MSKSVHLANIECQVSSSKQTPKVIIWDLIDKYSELNKLLRVTSYVIRFIDKISIKLKDKFKQKSNLLSNSWFSVKYYVGFCKLVSVPELVRARMIWIYLVQKSYFCKDIKLIMNNQKPEVLNLRRLDPFFDQNLLRLGGRIHLSLLDYDQKHPWILPSKCSFSKLLVDFCHDKTLRGGVRLTLSTLRQEFWVIKARNLVRCRIHKCNTCIRYRANKLNQKMGILPSCRVTRADKPFRLSGVDYAGPFDTLRFRGRGAHKTLYKSYIAVFVCMNTKAVHLELVTGYSSQDFIAAFRRFTSTRGQCSELFSDQGTTFVGADRILKEMYVESSEYIHELVGSLANEGTTWKFNSPGAPHFGGIWEAAVKSVKHHIRRVVGNRKLTFEEFYTLIKQIEACLNSRPLVPLTDDPSDNNFLSPSLLLTQSQSYILPEPNYLNQKIPPVQRYKLIQQMLQDWWRCWSGEYLQSLQERHKWVQKQKNVEVGDVVLISDETMPPSKWPLAKIIKVYKGPDGLVRVVDLKTGSTELKRPIHKLIMLNTLNNEQNENP